MSENSSYLDLPLRSHQEAQLATLTRRKESLDAMLLIETWMTPAERWAAELRSKDYGARIRRLTDAQAFTAISGRET